MNTKLTTIFLTAAISCAVLGGCGKEPVDYVNPYIGNVSHLLVPTFPTVQLPNSLLRVYPSRADYTSEYIDGLPIVVTNHRERSAFKLQVSTDDSFPGPVSYDNEHLTPYSFDMTIADGTIDVHYALSHQSAIYSFDAGKALTLVLSSLDGPVEVDGRIVMATQTVQDETKVHVCLETAQVPQRAEVIEHDGMRCAVLEFAEKSVNVRYGVSYIDTAQALANLRREQQDYDVRRLAREGRRIWNDALRRIDVKGGTEDDKTVFYTSYYRTFERPVCISEDGRYWSAFDNAVHEDGGVPFYTDDWIWDTYRAAHPLRILMDRSIEEDILDSYLRMACQMGNMCMPTFPEVTGDSRRMNSNHAIATFADAIAKGLNVDADKAFEASFNGLKKKTLCPWCGNPAGKLDEFYWTNGYFPALRDGEAETDTNVHPFEKRQPVAVSLGTAYDCWCMSRIAAAAGRQEDERYFLDQSANYRKLFNPETGFFHPKDSDGNFIPGIDYDFPGGMGAREYYDENNAWVYRWDVQHDIPGLIGLMGGPEKFCSELDRMFARPLGRSKFEFFAKLPDHSGNIGQFSMANEPSLHVPYLYNYAGSPWKTQKRVRQMLDTWFRNDLMGVPGDEDGGGLTSFVVFSSLGLYPVTPGRAEYSIGSPLFRRSELKLSNGNSFVIVAKGVSRDNKYIQSATIDGKALDTPFIPHDALMAGGKLVLVMGPRPNKSWGTGVPETKVVFLTPSIVRIFRGSVKHDPSFSIVKRPERNVVVAESRDVDGNRTYSSSELTVLVNAASGRATFLRPDGRELVSEKCFDAEAAEVSFLLDESEAIYGLGQHKDSGLNQRGRSWTLQNNNTEIGIPLVHSSKAYAIYWDNYSTTTFSDGPDGMSFRSEDGQCCDYYVIVGNDADGVISGIRELSGDAPLNPLWSYGFHQSRERYLNQDELVGTVEKFRELGVPLDGIIQDWRYWGEDHKDWNSVEFGNPGFSDPEAMLRKVHGLNAHCLISVWPSFGRETAIRADLEKAGLLLSFETFPQENDVKVYDAFNSRARDIYWSYMDRNLFSKGVDGWWLDATEPEHGPVREGDYDIMTAEGRFGAMRNAFPLYSVGGVYDHQRAVTSAKRVFNLTRSASLGIQRYGAHIWSGDLTSGWDELHYQIAEALNLSLCGIPYWNSDIGGFFAAYNYPDGNRNPEFRRLYLRWMQFATFTGMMRSHGTHTPREIFLFGNPGDFDFDAQLECIKLRYSLLPYIYSTAWQITSGRATLDRALMMDWPDDPKAMNTDDEFMFGRSILVAPVTDDAVNRTVYLPEGEWTDFWNGTKITGPLSFSYDAPLDRIPLFVRAGSIIPMGPDVQYAGEKDWDNLEIRVYPGTDGSFTLYEDEGDGYGYEKGRYGRIVFGWDDAKRELSVSAVEGGFPGMLKERDFHIVADSVEMDVHYTGNAIKKTLK